MTNLHTKPAWFKPRGYVHIDASISYEQIEPLVKNQSIVAKWEFLPLLRYMMIGDRARGIEQRKAKHRPISYASHRDTHLYAYYAQQLGDRYDHQIKIDHIDHHVIAFRSGTGLDTIDHAKTAFETIKSYNNCVVIASDITGFFDNLNHRYLKERICSLLNVHRLPDDYYHIFRSVTKYAWVDRGALLHALKIGQRKADSLHPKKGYCKIQEFRSLIKARGLIKVNKVGKGIPQGTPISALLSNIYMLEFDKKISSIAARLGGHYWRYCDDILIVLPDLGGVMANVEQYMKDAHLSIHPDKTETYYFNHVEGRPSCKILKGQKLIDSRLQYLGLIFDGDAVRIRQKSLDKQIRRIHRAVSLARQTRDKYNEIREEAGQPTRPMYRRKIYKIHSPLGKLNFHSYARRCSARLIGLGGNAIHRQIHNQVRCLRRAIRKADSG